MTERKRASDLKGAEALRWTSLIAQLGSMQPKVCAEIKRLLSIFFASSAGVLSDLVLGWAFTALPLAFVAEEEVRGHSLTVCPTPPQNKHKLFVKRRAHSVMVSLPSFPILSFRSDVFLSEFWEDDPGSCGTNGFFWCLFWLLFKEEEDCWFCDLLTLSVGWFPRSRWVSSFSFPIMAVDLLS